MDKIISIPIKIVSSIFYSVDSLSLLPSNGTNHSLLSMKELYKKIIIYLFYSCLFSPVYGNTGFFFSHLGVQDGLSQLSVLNIFQDSDGYLWFGTRNGANRYDGYEFKIYRNEVNNPASLSDNYIRGIAEDSIRNIWIGTNNGLNCIDYRSGKITRFYPQTFLPGASNTITGLFTHADGNLYALTSHAIFKCNPDLTLEPISHLKDFPASFCSIGQDKHGIIYIGTENDGLYVFSKEWKQINHFKEYEESGKTVSLDAISAILEDDQGVIWLGTSEKGLIIYHKKEQTFHRMNKENSGLSNNYIRTLAELDRKTLLVGTFGGLNLLNKKDFTFSSVGMNTTGKGGLSHYSIYSILVDKDKTVWIGTYSAGINYYSPYIKPVSYIVPEPFAGVIGKGEEDAEGKMWFGTEGAGLFYYDPVTGQQQLYPIRPIREGNYEINIIKSILIHGDSIFCTTHFGSVYLFSRKKRQYKKIHDFHYNDIYSLYLDKKERLWIPTHTNHDLILAEKGSYSSRFPAGTEVRSFQGVTRILETEPDVFLFGTLHDSIFLYDRNRSFVKNLSPLLNAGDPQQRLGAITSILKDGRNNIWISTARNGLYRLNKAYELVKHYQKENGLADSYISSLTLDAAQNIWVATNNELYHLDSGEDKFRLAKTADRPIQEFTLYAGNNKGSDGTLYFPGDKGILALNPDKMIPNPCLPSVLITDIAINNGQPERTVPGDAFTLQAGQNNLTIRYTALNFIHTKENQYAFKLEGVDTDWHTVGNRREAYYSNLQPGTYTFRVKASNNDGVWNPGEAILPITVRPPFYKTWWACFLYSVLFLGVLLVIIRLQQQKHEREREARYKQLEQEKTNELHEERMRMFTNFSHELRTPLTLIINPVDELLQHISFSPEIKSLLQMIKKNTGRMLALVNNLMDIQKYEAGQTILQKSRFDLHSFIREIYLSFESVAQHRAITFELENQLPAPYPVYYDVAEMEKVFFNLLSNAFKFTPSDGKIRICIRSLPQEACRRLPLFPADQCPVLTESNYLCIEVSDTGKGLNQDDLRKIFEPFYRVQGDHHAQIAGTGIGLSLVRSIVSQHDGCIWAESNENKGTCFKILLPDTEKQTEKKAEAIPAVSKSSEIHKKVNLLMEENTVRNKPVILLANDHTEVLEYLEHQLNTDYKIVKAANGKEALAQIRKSEPHLVISDVVMSQMNGLEFCRRLKEDPDYCHIPVILLTAKSLVSQIEEGLEAGADDYMVKPFPVSLLKARIKNLISLREKMKNLYGKSFILKNLGVEEPAKENDFLHQYIEIVKSHISNPELDVSVIYQTLGMSRANFYRKVKNVTGLSPIELIRNIRLEAGAKLLKESNLNISEIAQRIGFSSRSYFARNFKEVYGMSPTDYQETYKSRE